MHGLAAAVGIAYNGDMNSSSILTEVLSLEIPERIRLAQQIWESIAEAPESIPLTDAQREVILDRLEKVDAGETSGRPWSEVKRQLRGNDGTPTDRPA